jgi:NAD(P)-dependent dehydrogenase (short-subunit alcohol dehydrogenase family)
MVKQGGAGRIIGASSLAGKKGHAMYAGYCASKFAVRGLTQSAGALRVVRRRYKWINQHTASELGKMGITVNAYAPGMINTPMSEAFFLVA